MKHALGKKLRYLEDDETVKAITEGTYDILTDLDEPTKYILEEIGNMGMNIRHEECAEIIITPEDFKGF